MEQHSSPFLMSSDHVSRRHQWFTCVHLLISHLTQSGCAFSVTLTTPALYRRSLRWFGGCFQKPPPEGLPPSQLQLRADRLCSRVTPEPPWQFSFTAKERLFFVPFVVQGFYAFCSTLLRGNDERDESRFRALSQIVVNPCLRGHVRPDKAGSVTKNLVYPAKRLAAYQFTAGCS